MQNETDNIRMRTLDRIEKTERNYKLAFVGAAIVEAAFFAAFILLADMSNRSHLLLLLTSVAVYTIVAFGLIALGIHVNRNTLRVLKAIEMIVKNEK